MPEIDDGIPFLAKRYAGVMEQEKLTERLREATANLVKAVLLSDASTLPGDVLALRRALETIGAKLPDEE